MKMKTTIKKLFRNAFFVLLSVISFEVKADTIPLNFLDTNYISYAFYYNSDFQCYQLSFDRALDRYLQVGDSVFVNIYDDVENLVFNSKTNITSNVSITGDYIPTGFYTNNSLVGSGQFSNYGNKSHLDFSCRPLNYSSIRLEIFIKTSTSVFKLMMAFGSVATGVTENTSISSSQNAVFYDVSGIEIFRGTLEGFYQVDYHGFVIVKPDLSNAYKIYKL